MWPGTWGAATGSEWFRAARIGVAAAALRRVGAIALVACVVLAAACGHSSPPLEDGPRAPDAATTDGPPSPIDGAPPDASVTVAQLPGADVAAGAARVTGATYTLDVVVGPVQPTGTAAGPTMTFTDNAAIRP